MPVATPRAATCNRLGPEGVVGGVAASMTLIIGVNAAVNANAGSLGQWSAWWSVWSLIGWGAGLTVHGLVVRLARRNLFQHDWEERKIDEILDQQRRP